MRIADKAPYCIETHLRPYKGPLTVNERRCIGANAEDSPQRQVKITGQKVFSETCLFETRGGEFL